MQIDWDSLFSQVYQTPGDITINRATTLGSIVSALLDYIFPIAGLALLLYLLFGGFRFLTSGGNPKSAQAAQSIITTALIGFIIVFVSYWIVQFAGIALGLGELEEMTEIERGTCACQIDPDIPALECEVVTNNCNTTDGYFPECQPLTDCRVCRCEAN